MLAARLKALVVQGIVTRQVFAGPPVRVEYTLTPAGHGFRDVQAAIGAWGEMLDLPRARTPASGKASGKARGTPKAARKKAGPASNAPLRRRTIR
jgi:DNA-binding HxlR family transcriptional regulator